MAIQKKSLISKLNTTKKAIVASSTPADNPSVSSPVKTQISRGQKLQVGTGRLAVSTGRMAVRP